MRRPVAVTVAVLVATILAASIWPDADAADPVPGPLAPANPASDEPEYSGVFACLGCHSAGEQSPYGDSRARVRLDEVLVWNQQDKHRLAYCVLTGELGQRMSALLGYDVAKANQCLACHAPRREQRGESADVPPNYKLAEGVTCEDCHGGSRGWHRLHILKDHWRGLTAVEKKSHGMNDLRDPLTRAAVCLDCHVGNAAQAQIVTHEMYAAGHPPLASVDIVSYADGMPSHWLSDRQRAENGAPRAETDAMLNTRLALTGYLVSGARALRLAGRSYEGLPDFAAFDCDACHHELSSPSWRLARGALGTPGRPGYREWSIAMAATVSAALGDEATNQNVQRILSEMRATLQLRAFGGDSEAASKSPLELADIWSAQAQSLTDESLDRAQVDRLIQAILEQSLDSARPPDYDTARALSWMLRTAMVDLGISATENSKVAWQSLEAQLSLKIPPRWDAGLQSAGVELTCATAPSTPIAAQLPGALERRAMYDPMQFQQAMRDYRKAMLGEEGGVGEHD